MKPTRVSTYAVLACDALCTGALVYIMAALPVHKEQVFLDRGTITVGGELAILVAFVLVLMFNIVSILWASVRIRQARQSQKGDSGILALGVLCLILLVGDKALVDEISHEYSLGSEASGEWIVLYVCFAIQLLYNIIVMRKLHAVYMTQRSQHSAG
jgi:hypothetical protein